MLIRLRSGEMIETDGIIAISRVHGPFDWLEAADITYRQMEKTRTTGLFGTTESETPICVRVWSHPEDIWNAIASEAGVESRQ